MPVIDDPVYGVVIIALAGRVVNRRRPATCVIEHARAGLGQMFVNFHGRQRR